MIMEFNVMSILLFNTKLKDLNTTYLLFNVPGSGKNLRAATVDKNIVWQDLHTRLCVC